MINTTFEIAKIQIFYKPEGVLAVSISYNICPLRTRSPCHDSDLLDLDAGGDVLDDAEVGGARVAPQAVANLAHQPPATHRVRYLWTWEELSH